MPSSFAVRAASSRRPAAMCAADASSNSSSATPFRPDCHAMRPAAWVSAARCASSRSSSRAVTYARSVASGAPTVTARCTARHSAAIVSARSCSTSASRVAGAPRLQIVRRDQVRSSSPSFANMCGRCSAGPSASSRAASSELRLAGTSSSRSPPAGTNRPSRSCTPRKRACGPSRVQLLQTLTLENGGCELELGQWRPRVTNPARPQTGRVR